MRKADPNLIRQVQEIYRQSSRRLVVMVVVNERDELEVASASGVVPNHMLQPVNDGAAIGVRDMLEGLRRPIRKERLN